MALGDDTAPAGQVINVGGASLDLVAARPTGRSPRYPHDGQLRLLRLRPLRSVGTLQTGGQHIPAAFWPTAGRLVAVAGGDEPAVVVSTWRHAG